MLIPRTILSKLVESKNKFLILTNSELFNYFINKSKGKIADGIEILICNLPPEIQAEVNKVQRMASDEQR
ncbi:MAG: hypothetical protein A9183_03705 [Dehalococcoides mccartyi]|nr:MAG: hypothetical protein A9183_03705 [Dehalococcoides mccartyi]